MVIGELTKNSTEKYLVQVRDYRGREFIDLRVYYLDDSGEWCPTKKGLTITADKVSKLVELIQLAENSCGGMASVMEKETGALHMQIGAV
ncbi:MAG: transcriptional coactivator p15/PC4 family protein [Nitrospirae bacterium]|nr:transcriptional coactivator p15/PC4 family protein [Nitrospirota bacterium]